MYILGISQLFGSKSAPLNFARVPDFCCHVLASLLAVAADHCVDDISSIEKAPSSYSAFAAWRTIAEAMGWDIPDSKSPPPASVVRTLGADTDLSSTPVSPPIIRIAPFRAEHLDSLLAAVQEAGSLSAGLAGQLYGKLVFAASQLYGRFGCAKLRPFVRRQHEPSRLALNPQLKEAIAWWRFHLFEAPPRTVPVNPENRPYFVSYSDGEGDLAGVGIALFAPKIQNFTPLAGYIAVPKRIRELWARQRQRTLGYFDIQEIEAIGPLLILHNWGYLLRDALWVHYIDNAGALAALVKGSSSVTQTDLIVGDTWSRIASLSILPWFDRVDTKSNPVDGLSRGKMNGPWRLVEIQTPSLDRLFTPYAS